MLTVPAFAEIDNHAEIRGPDCYRIGRLLY